jgi:hypothetical protein
LWLPSGTLHTPSSKPYRLTGPCSFAAAQEKSFKVAIVTKSKTQYLAANAGVTSNAAQAVECTLAAGALKCGGKYATSGLSMLNDMAPLTFGSSPQAKWSVSGDHLVFDSNPKNQFSLRGSVLNVEHCPHGHFPDHGTAKVIYSA